MAASRSASRADEDRPRLRRAGPVHHRRGGDPRRRAARQPRAPRLPGGRGRGALQVVPRVGDRPPGPGLAAAGGDARRTASPVDLVIPTKFPSYLVRHPRKVAWLFHQHREAYDLYGTSTARSGQPRGPTGARGHPAMDTAALSECRAVFTISRNVSDRLSPLQRPARHALYPPPHHLGRYHCDGYGDYLFYAGRLDRLKRLELAIDAMARAKRRPAQDRGRGRRWQRSCRSRSTRLGVADRVELPRLRLRGGARRPLRGLPRRLLRAPGRGLRLRHRGGLPLAQARGHHHRRRRTARVRDGRRERPRGRARSRRGGRPPSTGSGRCRRRGCARWARRAARASTGITWDHVIDRLTESLA